MNKNYLLGSPSAKKLYKYADKMPIFDFHCHLSPKEIYEDEPFKNITQMWLYFDHYKWRAMRYKGVSESLVTGPESDYNRFLAYAKVVSRLPGSPLFHWTKMELSKFFGVDEALNEKNAEKIFEICNKKIKDEKMSPRSLIVKSGVKFIGTTDDPCDTLEYHQKLKYDFKECAVAPTFRPDMAYKIENKDYKKYIEKLESASGLKISSYKELIAALENRIEFFCENGCVSSDHSIEGMNYTVLSDEELEAIFQRALKGEDFASCEIDSFKINSIEHLSNKYNQKNMVMQLHIGAIRNNNPTIFEKIGVDAGADSPDDFCLARQVSTLLQRCEKNGTLPKTILYNLNEKDFLSLASQAGNFPKENIAGRVQLGSAWWFNDHIDGIKSQLKTIASQSMLSSFVGMLTDSRSFLSYARHDYFRRILCSVVGEFIEKGEYEADEDILREIIEGISYTNAREFFLGK